MNCRFYAYTSLLLKQEHIIPIYILIIMMHEYKSEAIHNNYVTNFKTLLFLSIN